MTPLIRSGQKHVLSPINLSDVEVGDIVFCKVKGRYYTHLVKAKGDRGVLIGNNHGKINGWTKSVFGKVTKILYPLVKRIDYERTIQEMARETSM